MITRDRIALEVMKKLLNNKSTTDMYDYEAERIAEASYKLADKMIEKSKKK